MLDYLAIFNSDQSVIESLSKKHSHQGVQLKEDGLIKDRLPFMFNDHLTNQSLFISVDSSQKELINELFDGVLSQENNSALIFRYNKNEDVLKATIKTIDSGIQVKDIQEEKEYLSLRIIEKCGKYNLDDLKQIKGVSVDEISQFDRTQLANGLETAGIYKTSTVLVIDNVEHDILTNGRLLLKEEDNEVSPVIKPVYKELEIPSILNTIDSEDIKDLEEGRLDYIEINAPNTDHIIFAFLDKERNKIVLIKEEDYLKSLHIKPANEEQSNLLLHLSPEEKKELSLLKTVNISKQIKDVNGNTFQVQAKLQPRINFIRKELSFKMKTLKQDKNLLKKNNPSI